MTGEARLAFRATFSLLAASALAACATPNRGQSEVAEAPASGGRGVQIGVITDAALPQDACGLILWTVEDERPAPAMRYVAGEGAVMRLNGQLTKLTLVEANGPSGFGVAEQLVFLIGDDDETARATVAVAFEFGLGFDGGSYLERGLVTIETDDGWRTVAPAAGIAGCRG